MNRLLRSLVPLLIVICLSACGQQQALSFALEDIPAFTSEPYVLINDNTPDFPDEDLSKIGRASCRERGLRLV